MNTSETVDRREQNFLRTLYELSDQRAKYAVSFDAAQLAAGYSFDQADEACDYWAGRGIIEYPRPNHVALTHMGLRRARRLAERGWKPNAPF